VTHFASPGVPLDAPAGRACSLNNEYIFNYAIGKKIIKMSLPSHVQIY